MARSRSSTLSTASNALDRGKQIETGLVDFVPHPPSRLDAYAYLEEPMEMTFGEFQFRVEKEGSYRLEIPISSGLSAVDPDFLDSTSSTESGEEEISSPRFISTRASEKLAKIFSDMSFESFADSDISDDSSNIDSSTFVDRSTTVGKVFTNLNDGVTKPRQSSKNHQIYVIGEPSRPAEETSENFDDARNPYVDPVDLTRGDNEDLKETFDNLDKFCLKLNPTKCSFGVRAGELLGFLVSARGIEANPEKIQAIATMRKPTKLKEIQQLTGRVEAVSRFVARLGEKALPFYALIKQGEKFQWNEEEDRAFEDLKRTISTPPILVAPKEKEPLFLYIAATPQVVSTALVVEREEEGKLHRLRAKIFHQ
ncbi:hypothetical protein QYE76_012610 [Lolium multiflorum]|uniref:Uncharacterized protein n=1 Tax=Lolium multiflorum TaxID=4521 RepID=A0AAD8X3T9_LOLMU|nr:hypothetical protein QYE76_012610 [Lolium multiflorum]